MSNLSSRLASYLSALAVSSIAVLGWWLAGADAQAATIPATNLMLWLDAKDINGDGNTNNNPSNGAAVAQWRDKSGNGYHAAQSNASKQPSYQATGFNGMPGVDFDGANDILALPSTSSVNQFTAFFMWNLQAYSGALSSSDDFPLTFQDGSINDVGRYMGLEIGQNGGASADTIDVFGGFAADTRGSATGISGLGNHRMLAWSSTATNLTDIWQNGSSVTSVATTPCCGETHQSWNFVLGGGTGGNEFGVGGFQWPSLSAGFQFFTDEMAAELIFYDAILSPDDRQLVEGILAWKWGLEDQLPGNHPFSDINPNIEIPEPATLWLLGAGAGILVGARRRRRSRDTRLGA